MSRDEGKKQRDVLSEIVELLSQLRTGQTAGQLTYHGDEHKLKPIVDEVNALAQHLQVQVQAQAHIQRYEYILDGAGLGSWDWWLESNEVSFDWRWFEMLGLKYEETPQHLSTWDSRVHPDDKASAYRDIKAYLAGETPVYENIHRMMHKDGRWVWILDRGRISEFDASGKAVRFTGTHFDISDLKNIELLNQKISADLKEAQSIAKIGSWTFDLLSQHLTWSSEHYKIFEINEPQSQESLYRLYRSRIHKDDLEHLDLLIERAAKHI
ncbi:MAG: PAS domain-containing protein [Oligoflexales bacterium]|nr:PAS domain-containing protein [Oligoflexales bacterium]